MPAGAHPMHTLRTPYHTPGRRAGTELRARDAAVYYVGRVGHGGQGLWRCVCEGTLLISLTHFTVRLLYDYDYVPLLLL